MIRRRVKGGRVIGENSCSQFCAIRREVAYYRPGHRCCRTRLRIRHDCHRDDDRIVGWRRRGDPKRDAVLLSKRGGVTLLNQNSGGCATVAGPAGALAYSRVLSFVRKRRYVDLTVAHTENRVHGTSRTSITNAGTTAEPARAISNDRCEHAFKRIAP